MKDRIFYCAGTSQALAYTVKALEQRDCRFAPVPDRSVTHLLLDVPHKNWACLPSPLEALGPEITVVGGNLKHSTLSGYRTVDLLEDPVYLAENANLTAHGAVKLALEQLPVTLHHLPVLVVGWGRIGKCLSRLLRQMGACVTVAVRKDADRAILLALGYDAVDIHALDGSLARYRVIFNTVPVPVLGGDAMACCSGDCLKIELASQPGMAGTDIVCGRGLPSRYIPESSGALIARTVLRLCREVSQEGE